MTDSEKKWGRQELEVQAGVDDGRPFLDLVSNGEHVARMAPVTAFKVGAMILRGGEAAVLLGRLEVALETLGAPKEFVVDVFEKMVTELRDDTGIGGSHSFD